MSHAPLRFLLDENLRGPLWDAIRHQNTIGPDRVDAVRVGDGSGPPLATPDPDILIWAENEGRILVTVDKRTMPVHLRDQLRAG